MLYALLNGYDEFSMWPLSENEQEALDYLWIFRATEQILTDAVTRVLILQNFQIGIPCFLILLVVDLIYQQ